MIGKNTHALEVFDIDLLGLCCVVETKIVGDNRIAGLPYIARKGGY